MSVKNPGKTSIKLPWTGQEILAKFKAAIERKANWKSLYQDAFNYITPQRDTFDPKQAGQKKGQLQYDNTAMEAANTFVSRIMATITPSWQVWSEFRAGSDIPEKDRPDINKQLSEINAILFDFINHSNFTTQASETYMDLIYGTGAMIIEEGDSEDLLVFTNIPLSELYLEEGPNSSVQTVYRLIKPLTRNLKTLFPKGKFSDSVKKDMIAPGETDRTDIVTASMFHPKTRIFFQVVMEHESAHIVQFHVEKTNPYIVPRWSVVPGEIFGRGPAIDMLPTIKSANKVAEFELRAAAMAVSGAYTVVSDGVINPFNLQIKPNMMIPVKAPDTIQPLALSGSPEFSQLVLSKLQDDIKMAFLADPMPGFDDPVRTATEIQIRNSNFLKKSGAQLGRLKSEWVEKVIERSVDILQRVGKMPAISIDGREVTIKHTSPLAKIEDQEDLIGFSDFLNIMDRIEPHSPGVTALTVKIEDVATYISDKTGGFEQLIRTPDEAKNAAATVIETGQALAASAGVEVVEGVNV